MMFSRRNSKIAKKTEGNEDQIAYTHSWDHLAASGFNVCRIGVVSWMDLETTSVLMVVGSIVTLLLFSTMFVKMLFKNVRRIRRIEVDKRRLWHMMPVKSYAIMAFMITFGILLRNCPAIPSAFIASFYVGLGSALMVAGTVYISALLCPKEL